MYPPSAGIPGPRDPFLTPYMIAFGRAVAARTHRRVVLACSAQMGKSDTLLDIIGQRMEQAPAPILYVGPNQQFLREQWEPRVMELLDQAPSLRDRVSRGKRMTKTRKIINGVPLRLAHAGSSTALKSDPAALALTDEADELMANVRGQGDPVGLVDRRGETYADFVHAIVSTPGEGPSDVELDEASGLEFWKDQEPKEVGSTIWKLWQQGTRFHWCWPCPHCRDYFVPRFRCLKWPKDATPADARTSAFVACPRCGGVIEEHHKEQMNARGRYVAPGQKVTRDGEVIGYPPFTSTVSFWVSGLCSPFRTFGDRASEFLTAVRSGDSAEIQSVINGGFGELWASQHGEAPDWAEVSRRAAISTYRRGEVPDPVKFITVTCDVQKRSIYWVARGWGPRATSFLIDYGQLLGETAEEEIWVDLADLIGHDFGADADGQNGVPAKMVFIDSGFRPGKPDALPINRVYEFCRLFPHRVRATKGSSTPMRTPLIANRIEVTSAGKASRFGLELIRLDTDHWKSWVHERLRWPADQLGSWHLPNDIDDDYAQQIVSEARVKKPSGQVTWVQRSRANHYFDCEAMQAAAGYLLNAQRIPGGIAVPEEPDPAPAPEERDREVVAPRRTLAAIAAERPKPLFRRRVLHTAGMG